MADVGILTFHWANHIGAVLQVYALCKILSDMGYDTEVINFVPRSAATSTIRSNKLVESYRIHRSLEPAESIVMSALRFMARGINYVLRTPARIRSSISFENFRRGYLRVSPTAITSLEELRLECSRFEAVIVGSDQVWNPEFLESSGYAYLLPFKLAGTKKIGFSASIAVDPPSIPGSTLELYRRYLQDFSFISLRERPHARMLAELLGREIYHTLDPVLLVSREVFERIANTALDPPYSRYVLVYNLDTSLLPLIRELEEAIDLPVVVYVKPSIFSVLYDDVMRTHFEWVRRSSFYSAGPGEFIALLKRAELVVTNSYHGVALSILFEKPFIAAAVGLAFKTKTRILDLLEILNLNRRLVFPGVRLTKVIDEDIYYAEVRRVLNTLRESSLKLLRRALKE